MNCDDYKQLIGADPNFDGGAGHYEQVIVAIGVVIHEALVDAKRGVIIRVRVQRVGLGC